MKAYNVTVIWKEQFFHHANSELLCVKRAQIYALISRISFYCNPIPANRNTQAICN